jgi:hypothetical protein
MALQSRQSSMIQQKKTDIIDKFISKLQSHPTAMKKAQRIDDLEAVLRTLFTSGDEQAIEMSDKIRDVLERKHVPMAKRISMLEKFCRRAESMCEPAEVDNE